MQPRSSSSRLDNSSLFVPSTESMIRHPFIAPTPPELLSPLRTLDQVQRFRVENGIATSLADVLTDPLGYYLFRFFMDCQDDSAGALCFLEDVVSFKLTSSPMARLQL
jgi:hypothetical protein